MHPYIPNGKREREEMLAYIGAKNVMELFADIPKDLQLKNGIDIPDGLTELEVSVRLNELANKNTSCQNVTCFMGAGAYDSFIPSAVKHVVSRSEFYTAYTPYQPEISQGTLQGIFEFQTMICELTGMDVSNASMYDGASASAEAALMAVGINKKKKVIASRSMHPETRKVLKTYLKFRDIEFVEAPIRNGKTDIDALRELVDGDTGAVLVQNPNFFGIIEDGIEIGKIVHATKALYIVSVADALSLAVLKSPGELGADITVGEGQAFGMELGYGGPYLGFMATTDKYLRKLPGRICGETKDVDGKRAYVLTLQAREQHIRREKATSNICSNHALCALIATVYLSLMGKEGLKDAAIHSGLKSRYLKDGLDKVGFKSLFKGDFFREFAVMLPMKAEEVNSLLLSNGILGGYDLGKDYPEYKGSMLLCTTEKRTKEEMDKLIKILASLEVAK